MRLILILNITLFALNSIAAEKTCVGKFINPITDISWGCVLPITIGGETAGVKIPGMKGPKGRDIKNPESPACACIKEGVPVPGITIGFWEPVRLIEITRTPYCMVGLGGVCFGEDKKRMSTSKNEDSHTSFYHVHYYMYPLIYWLELLTDFVCLEEGQFDLAYMSEFDPTWNDDKLGVLLNPEALIFGNPIAQAACAADCVAANVKMPLDSLFWCAGCLGNIYPFAGWNADHFGGVQSSSLLSIRAIAKLHRTGLAKETSTTSSAVNGDLCRKSRKWLIKKSQYKLQMAYPKYKNDMFSCVPLGMSDIFYGSMKEFPIKGQDWVYILWRKTNCCAL
jgi:conjugal transfer pilus assembly protein TraU